MNQEKQIKFLLSIAYYGIILFGVFLGIKFLLPPLAPFIIGFFIAWALRKPVLFLAKKLRVTYKLPAAVLTAVFFILIIAILFFAGTQLASGISEGIAKLPSIFSNQILPLITSAIDAITDFAEQFDIAIAEQIDEWLGDIISSMSQMITAISSWAVKFISGLASGMPSFILKVILSVISAFYFSLDFERIIVFIQKITPKKIKDAVHPVKKKLFTSLKIFIRSYFLIFLLTFAELSIGFLILRVPYAVLLAFLISIIDLMPVLGTGLIVLPWIVICFIIGKIPFGFGLLVLYIIITAIRNIVEPKLVGQQIGLYPLATLISMFVGLQLFSIVGMFVFPVTLSLLIQFNKDGVIKLPFLSKKSENEASPVQKEPNKKEQQNNKNT